MSLWAVLPPPGGRQQVLDLDEANFPSGNKAVLTLQQGVASLEFQVG